jgi:hypothetical protein
MSPKVEYNLPNSTIEVKGQMGDGRVVRINTQGNVVIRTKKQPWEDGQEFYFSKWDRFPDKMEFELVADLSELGNHVFTIKVEPLKVLRTASAAWGSNIDTLLLAKRLGVPKEHTFKINKNKGRIVFTWEEEV